MTILNIAVAGSSGRMGRALLSAIMKDPGSHLQAALEMDGSPYIGKDVSELTGDLGSVVITDNFSAVLPGCDVLIDFTQPEGTIKHLSVCRAEGIKMVIGTTGFSAEQKEVLKEASKDIALVVAPNMSVGVNVTFKLLDIAAKVLGEGYDIEIVEAHHNQKVDAPSGTALMLGQAAADGRGVNLADASNSGRDGITGARRKGDIGFSAIRGGDIVGEHDVLFATAGERITLRHVASDRAVFARGALKAALWGQNKAAGAYDMLDVLGL